MRDSRHMEELLQRKGQELPIPERLEPEQMHKMLETYRQNKKEKRYRQRKYQYAAMTTAACLLLSAGILFQIGQRGFFLSRDHPIQAKAEKEKISQELAELPQEEQKLLAYSGSSYEEIYACLSQNWKLRETIRGEAAKEETAFAEGIADLETAETAGSEQKLQTSDDAFGRTNTREEQVDEADQVKNDGRYLYQIIRRQQKDEYGSDIFRVGIQILDTREGLAETAFVDGFESLEEFCLWEDLLITMENKYYDNISSVPTAERGSVMEDTAAPGGSYRRQGYHEICIYDIADRSRPRKLKTFTLQGTYVSSRISEGYFYAISRFQTDPGEGKQDYDAYIPSIDGIRLEAEKICCPPDADGTDYLVLVSIDLSDPFSFTDSCAVLSGTGTFYVSRENLYVACYRSVYETEPVREGKIQDTTKLLRFSFRNGKFYGQAEGEIPGRVESSFSLDEYGGNLRAAVTVQQYQVKEIIDDRTGERVGFDYGEAAESNALYILGPDLAIKGRMEGLAEGETIQSVRFLGEAGYFVTFRRTDPLFAVDLSDPEKPEVIGELKVSGFSEYLHYYGDNLLLGLGMEADEETGREQGMKLSMFDISDPTDLKEISRFGLKDYNYSEALWEYRAVLIDREENIIGFEAEGSKSGGYWKHYLIFSWQDGVFVQTLKADTVLKDGGYGRTRGTFIKDRFYLLSDNGYVRSYDRNTGELLEEI